MPRQEVTREQVAQAHRQLVERGEAPSVRAVRRLLGTGSTQTIMRHLAEIRAQQAPAPEADADLAEDLRRRHQELMERYIADIRERAEQRNATLHRRLRQQAFESEWLLTRLESTTARAKQHVERLHAVGDAAGGRSE